MSVKVIFPIWAWIFFPASTLKLTWPDLALIIAFDNYFSLIKVPILELGINPRGPSTFPNDLSFGNNYGVVNNI